MRTTFILIALAMFSSVGFSSTIYVPDDYPTIQQAIVAANPGDTVVVRPGTYHEAIDFLGKAITVTSKKGAARTTIDGSTFSGSIVTCQSGEGPDTVLDGFTIANGSANAGAGMHNVDSGPTITDCVFRQNHANTGGGMYNTGSTPFLKNCVFEANGANGEGGAMGNYYESTVTVEDSEFVGNTNGGAVFNYWGSILTLTNTSFRNNNTADSGGAIRNKTAAVSATDCTFVENTASGGGGAIHGSDGGGINFYNSMFRDNTGGGPGGAVRTGNNLTAIDCSFTGNTSTGASGGAVFATSYIITIANSTFSNNTAAAGFGGGVYLSPEEWATVEIVNSFFSENSADWGGGVMVDTSSELDLLALINNTFVANDASTQGGALAQAGTETTIANSIFWSNTAPRGPEMDVTLGTYGATLNISYSDVMGGQSSVYVEPGATLHWGTGMIDQDPLYLDPLNDDYHLTWLSPCINRGTNDGTPLEDIDGDPRPFMGTVDMGADEFVGTHPLAADGFSVSEVTGGTVNFTLEGGLDNNGRTYIVLGGVSGTAPGIPLPGGMAILPVNWDAFTNIVLALFNTSVFSNFLGKLDRTGSATAQLNTPPVPGFAGITMHYAYALNNPWDFVSNPVAVEIVP